METEIFPTSEFDQTSQPLPCFHIVLHQPEIPPNTGTIQRLCAATNTVLHLIGPLGFRLDDRSLRRAGMDYREWAQVRRYTDWADYLASDQNQGRLFPVSTKGHRHHSDWPYQPGDHFLFGAESRGLPQEILEAHQEHLIRLPMVPVARSLNLAVAAAIVLYEALRQNGYPNLS